MVIDVCQHGFHHGKSTVTNQLQCDTLIANYLNSDTTCDVISFDFNQAFNKINYGLLCTKLKLAGIDGCYLYWMVDYLSNRKQFISYKGACSALHLVTSGVVQDLAIEPSFFTLFINLCKAIKNSKSFLFAENLKIVADVSTPQCCKLAQKDVNAVADWSSKNMLPINFDKCISVHYGQFTPSHQYIILQHKIKAMHCLSDLSVCRSNTFAYAEDFLKRVFVSYIRQSLKYASSIW